MLMSQLSSSSWSSLLRCVARRRLRRHAIGTSRDYGLLLRVVLLVVEALRHGFGSGQIELAGVCFSLPVL